MSNLYELYSFKVDEDEGPEDPTAAGPVFSGEVPIVHVYRSARLVELMQEHDSAAAFAIWAAESLGMYDAAQRVADQGGYDVAALEQARGDALKAWHEATVQRGRADVNVADLALARAFKTYFAAGFTMRQIAAHVDKPLAVITQAVFHKAARADVFADVEEMLMNDILDIKSVRVLAVETGVSANCITRICDMHGLDVTAAAAARREASNAA